MVQQMKLDLLSLSFVADTGKSYNIHPNTLDSSAQVLLIKSLKSDCPFSWYIVHSIVGHMMLRQSNQHLYGMPPSKYKQYGSKKHIDEVKVFPSFCVMSSVPFQRTMFVSGGSSSNLTPLSYPGAGIQAMFGIGDRFSMFLSDTPVDGYMLDIIQENSRRFTSIELPDCRYSAHLLHHVVFRDFHCYVTVD